MKTVRRASLAIFPGLALSLTMLLASGPARAQSINIIPDTPSKTQDQIDREKEMDRQYKEGLRKIPNKQGSSDPWGGVRSSGTSAPASSSSASTQKSTPSAKGTGAAKPQ